MRLRLWLLYALAALLLLPACGDLGLERLPTPTGGLSPAPGIETVIPPPGVTPQPALLERRLLVLEWPRRILENDSGFIILTLTAGEDGRLTPTIQTPDGSTNGMPLDVEIPNLYDTHNIVAVARLDMAGLEAYRESIRETLRPGRSASFRWSVRADEAGIYRGVVWLHLELIPKNGGSIDQLAILARNIEIEAVTILGLSGEAARILGLLGLVTSTILGYPFIQRAVEKFLKRRREAAGPTASTASPPDTAGTEQVEKALHPPDSPADEPPPGERPADEDAHRPTAEN